MSLHDEKNVTSGSERELGAMMGDDMRNLRKGRAALARVVFKSTGRSMPKRQ